MESRMRRKGLSKRLGKTSKEYIIKFKKKWRTSYSGQDERVIQIIEDILTSGKPYYHIPRYVTYNPHYYIDNFIR